MYIKPEENAKVSTQFNEQPRTYDSMYRWMSKLCLIHGGVKYGEEE